MEKNNILHTYIECALCKKNIRASLDSDYYEEGCKETEDGNLVCGNCYEKLKILRKISEKYHGKHNK